MEKEMKINKIFKILVINLLALSSVYGVYDCKGGVILGDNCRIDTTRSTLSVDSSEITADGMTTATITVHLKNKYEEGNADNQPTNVTEVTNIELRPTNSLQQDVIISSVDHTHSDEGIYSFTVKSHVTEEKVSFYVAAEEKHNNNQGSTGNIRDINVTFVPPALPEGISLEGGEVAYVTSVYDTDYMPYATPTSKASLVTPVDADSQEDKPVDIQGSLTQEGIDVEIPYVATKEVTLPAYQAAYNVPQAYTQDQTPRRTYLAYETQTLSEGSGVIHAKVYSAEGILQAKKLDINNGIGDGSDKILLDNNSSKKRSVYGVLFGTFMIAINAQADRAEIQSRIIAIGAVDANTSTVVANPTQTDVGTNAIVTVTLKDRFGHHVPGRSVTLTSSVNEGVSITPSATQDTPDGVHTFSVSSTKEQNVTFVAQDGNITITQTASVNFTHIPDPEDWNVTCIPNHFDVIVGTEGTTTCHVEDRYHNPIDENVTLTFDPSVNSITHTSNGNYTVTVSSTITEDVTYTPTVNGILKPNGKFIVHYMNSAGTLVRSLDLNETNVTVGDDVVRATIVIEDDKHNLKVIPASDVKFSDSHGNATIKECHETNQTATYTCLISNHTAETVTFTTNVTGVADKDQKNASVMFRPDCGKVDNLIVTISRDSTNDVIANGTDTAEIIVQVKGKLGNACTTGYLKSINIAQTGLQNTHITQPTQSNDNGNYVGSVTSTTVGTVSYIATVTAKDNTRKQSNEVSVNFIPGDPSALYSLLEVNDINVTAGDKVRATLTVKDANNHPVPNVDVDRLKFYIDGKMSSIITPADDNITITASSQMLTDKNGTYYIDINDTEAETIRLRATVDGDNLPSNQERNVTYTYGVLDYDKSYMELDKKNYIQNGNFEDRALAINGKWWLSTLQDAYYVNESPVIVLKHVIVFFPKDKYGNTILVKSKDGFEMHVLTENIDNGLIWDNSKVIINIGGSDNNGDYNKTSDKGIYMAMYGDISSLYGAIKMNFISTTGKDMEMQRH